MSVSLRSTRRETHLLQNVEQNAERWTARPTRPEQRTRLLGLPSCIDASAAHRLWASSSQHFSRVSRSCARHSLVIRSTSIRSWCVGNDAASGCVPIRCAAYPSVTCFWDRQLELPSPNAEGHLYVRVGRATRCTARASSRVIAWFDSIPSNGTHPVSSSHMHTPYDHTSACLTRKGSVLRAAPYGRACKAHRPTFLE